MKERPIIFSSEMVKAILDGRKTQTRRAVKPRAGRILDSKKGGWEKCPYGQPGDRLWVRESYFFPRSMPHITLEITGVRVERVRDIGEEDAYAEGRSLNDECDPVSRPGARWFQNLWDSLNAKRGYGWEVNPFVWVIEFKRIEEGKG